MCDREEVIKCIEATRAVAIIRGMAPEICFRLAKAYQEGTSDWS